MSSEFIGHVSNREGSDIVPPKGPVIDKDYIVNHAQAAEQAGIDRLLIGAFSTWPDNNQIAAHVFSRTERIGALLAHRPGFIAPTLAARQLATLDQFSGGAPVDPRHHRRLGCRSATRWRLSEARPPLRPYG